MKIIWTTLTILVALLVAAATAQAGTAFTGPLQGQTFICSIVNVGDSAIKSVTIDITNSGTGQTLATNTCTDLAPSLECRTRLDIPGGNAAIAFCGVTATDSATNLRGNLVVILGANVFVLDLR
jgi:hypothetical protein